MKIDQLLDDVRDCEARLARQLRTVAERHAAEHDVYHLGHSQARSCGERIEQLAAHAERYGAGKRTPPRPQSPGLIEEIRHKGSELLGRSTTAGQLLLTDLRELYLVAQANELAWVILLQSGQAVRDRDLLETATECHEHATMCAKWVRTRIKETAPQVYAAG
jgi:cell division septum initiation protein DivIVA